MALVPDMDEHEKDLPRLEGRLASRIEEWRKITSDPFILSIILNGYSIEWDPLKGPPSKCDLPNH
eukprot:1138432-Rhodomonas_salina.1